MPIKKVGTPKINTIALIVHLILFLAMTVLSFANGGLYRNYFVFGYAAIVIGAFIIHTVQLKLKCRKCTEKSLAQVNNVVIKDTYFDMDLSHTWGYSAVRCYENFVPDVGDQVSVHYCPDDPSLAMLSMYKTHTPSWSKTTPKNFKSSLRVVAIFGLFFVALGSALIYVVYSNIGSYREPAVATVVDIVPEYKVNSGSYEYFTVFAYEVDGETRTSKDLAIRLVPAYEIGEQVNIKYDPNNPNAVVVAGDNSTITGATFMVLLGIGIFSIAPIRRCSKLKSYKDPDEEIDYLEA